MKILVSEGNYKHTLGIVRELGLAGYDVFVLGSAYYKDLAGYSKHCKGVLELDYKSEQEFIDKLCEILNKSKFDYFIPVGFPIVKWVSKQRDRIRKLTQLNVADFETIELLSNKESCSNFASSLGIPVPKTFYPQNIEDVRQASGLYSYPIVVKGKFEVGTNMVGYANNLLELETLFLLFLENPKCFGQPPLVQQYLSGVGKGFFALCKDGKCIEYFMHERIREYPISGGSSVCAKSIFDERILNFGQRILAEANYSGVAMVEFKENEHGDVFLLEVNPKFWGSYDLSRACGVNFATKLVELNNLNHVATQKYRIGVVFSWVFNGDLLAGIEKKQFWKVLFNALRCKVKTNIIVRDFHPSLILFKREFRSIISKLLRK